MAPTSSTPASQLADTSALRLQQLERENAALRKERDQLLQNNAELQLATAGVTMGAGGKCVALSVPVAPLEGEHIPRHVDVRLDAVQSAALARLTKALDLQNAKLNSGDRCIRTPDTIRWLCEQIANKIR